MLCPFRSKYKGIIEKTFPKVGVVEGSHYPPDGVSPEEAGRQFVGNARQMLCSPRPTMSSLAIELYPELFPPA